MGEEIQTQPGFKQNYSILSVKFILKYIYIDYFFYKNLTDKT